MFPTNESAGYRIDKPTTVQRSRLVLPGFELQTLFFRFPLVAIDVPPLVVRVRFDGAVAVQLEYVPVPDRPNGRSVDQPQGRPTVVRRAVRWPEKRSTGRRVRRRRVGVGLSAETTRRCCAFVEMPTIPGQRNAAFSNHRPRERQQRWAW